MQAQPSFVSDRSVPRHPLLRAIREALGLGLFGMLLAGAAFGWTSYGDAARWVGLSFGLAGGVLMNAGIISAPVSRLALGISKMRRPT